MANFFRGTTVDQDGRWGKSDERLLIRMEKAGKFSPILDTKVNLKKVNLAVISKWITQKIIEIVGFEDEILISLIINLINDGDVDGKKLQLSVTAFLDKKAKTFVEELWTLLVDAQNQATGVPSSIIFKKTIEAIKAPPPEPVIVNRFEKPVSERVNRWGPTINEITNNERSQVKIEKERQESRHHRTINNSSDDNSDERRHRKHRSKRSEREDEEERNKHHRTMKRNKDESDSRHYHEERRHKSKHHEKDYDDENRRHRSKRNEDNNDEVDRRHRWSRSRSSDSIKEKNKKAS
jgi:serine/arginine repetitive matrix protein 1